MHIAHSRNQVTRLHPAPTVGNPHRKHWDKASGRNRPSAVPGGGGGSCPGANVPDSGKGTAWIMEQLQFQLVTIWFRDVCLSESFEVKLFHFDVYQSIEQFHWKEPFDTEPFSSHADPGSGGLGVKGLRIASMMSPALCHNPIATWTYCIYVFFCSLLGDYFFRIFSYVSLQWRCLCISVLYMSYIVYGKCFIFLSGHVLVNSWQGFIPTILPMIDTFGLTDATAD